ncbi:MAG TPA: glycosyltransferase family 2 protein [Pelolinea sp.]|nr:glycosyltransferase family 2 protein [Pelolinea sp.]
MNRSSNPSSLPLVTIVMPSYNQAKYLEKAILSVLEQDYPNIEFFVVDGGSKDDSCEIIRKYHQSRPDRLTWWVSEKDNGQADAINKGVQRAKGDIIAWLNSDDIYLHGAVGKAVRALNANPECGMVFGNLKSMDMDGQVLNTIRYGNWGLEDLMAFRIIGQPSVFMRREAFESAGGMDTTYDLLLDPLLFMRIAAKYEIKYIDDFFAAARFHSEAKNVSQARKYGDDAMMLVELMEKDTDFKEVFKKNRRKIISGAYRLGAHYLLDGGDNRKAFSWYIKSLWNHPPTALEEFPRIIFAFFNNFLPIEGLKRKYLADRAKKFTGEKFN